MLFRSLVCTLVPPHPTDRTLGSRYPKICTTVTISHSSLPATEKSAIRLFQQTGAGWIPSLSGILKRIARRFGEVGQRTFLLSFCATRAFTSFFTRVAGSGLSKGKRIVPLDVSYPLSSLWKASTTDPLIGKKLQ